MGIDMLTNWLMDLTRIASSPFYAIYSFLIQTTIYISVTALFIILFKQVFKNRLKARWHFLIWSVLLIRLIVPVLPSSPVSVFNTVKVNDDIVRQSSFRSYITEENKAEETDEDNYSVALGLQEIVEADTDKYNTESESVSGYTIRIDAIVTYIWISGTVILLGYLITVLLVYRNKLKKSRRECNAEVFSLLSECKNRINIKRNVNVYFADTTPMLIGLFKPSVYVPDALSETELEATLLHELNHMKHLDILWSTIATVVLCLNWFNPIIWFCFFMFKRDLEVYCDERTLKHAENKQNYAMLLLKTATARKEKFVFGTTSLQSGKADVKRRIRYMAKFRKPTATVAATAVIMISLLLLGCLTNAGAYNAYIEKNTTLENPANGCKMDIVLDKSFAGDDYLTGNGTFFEFHNDMSIEEMADRLITDNMDIGIVYQDDKQALFITDYRQSIPYLLLTKKVSDTKGEDVDDVVFLEALGTNTYLFHYTESMRVTNDFVTEKKYSYYFPEHLRADYRYINYKDHSYEFDISNPFDNEVELIHGDDVFNQLFNFYNNIYHYIETKEDENGGGEILIEDVSGEPLFKIFYNAETDTVKFKPYAAFAAESAKSVIYRLENAIQRQDRKQMESCFESFSDEDYQKFSQIKPDFELERIFISGIDNVNFKYSFNVHAMIDYNNERGANKHDKQFRIEMIGEPPKITYTNLSGFTDRDDVYESTESKNKQTQFINEKLGEPDLSDFRKTAFSSPPDVLYADNRKAIIGGDCGILIYSFDKKQVTLYASYTYLQKLGLSLPYGNASEDGRYVYIRDGMQSIEGRESANTNYLILMLDTEERTITELNGFEFYADRKSVFNLDYETKEKYGMDDNYVGGTYVEYDDNTIVYAQLKPDWSPENLSIVRYHEYTREKEEFRVFP